MRALLVPVLLLAIACGKVTDSEPAELSAGAASDAPRATPDAAGGGAGTKVDPVTGGTGGRGPATVVDAGMAPRDASTTPPKPAADSGNEEDAGASQEALCDGSDAMRLAYVSDGGGPLYPTFGFTNPRGHAYLGIDGKCRFFVGQNYMRGIISGTLSTSDAAQLAADLHWQDLDGWRSWGIGKDAGCPDAGIVAVMKAKAGAGCSCGCDPTAPKGLSDALKKAYEWLEKLSAQGKPIEGPMSAIVTETTLGGPPNQPMFDWPLSRSIKSIPNLLVELSDPRLSMGSGPFARFDDPAECAKFREMRAMTVAKDQNGSLAMDIIVTEGGMQYHLLARDELPSETENAWKALKASVPLPW